MEPERKEVSREIVVWIRTQPRDRRGRITVWENATGKEKQVLPVDALEGFSMGLYATDAPQAERPHRRSQKADAEPQTA